MLPRTWPRVHRRKSADSLFSTASATSSGHSSSEDGKSAADSQIPHSPEFLDERLPNEYFRQDIIRLVHQMRIPGWSHVAEDMALDLELNRISGALTNSVFSVKSPQYVRDSLRKENQAAKAGGFKVHRLPQMLLLRVYGPNVDLLIDRKKELRTVAELTKHNIGPRLLGTFQNGRFEQFLNAKPLEKEDLRQPDTSKQIARRMCDLHKNIPLSAEDRAGGPVVWQNLGQWMPTAKEKLQRFDQQTKGTQQRILHCEKFTEFEAAVQRYRNYLVTKYGAEPLMFCHNDTQYGNLLRVEPSKGSPLLRPQNEHRQLVVIDFEYSGPNPPAYDIANHFCEWMGDYHDPERPHHIWTDRYPTAQEQQLFVRSYVEQSADEFDEVKIDAQIDSLIAAAAEWRAAVSAFWATWGIVQSPEKPEFRDHLLDQNPNYDLKTGEDSADESHSMVVEEEEDSGEEFDYLSYSSEKLGLFWEDLRKLGLADAK